MHTERLDCVRCNEFTEYHRDDGDPDTVVRCDECGKRHSDDSVYFVDPDKRYERDESGVVYDPRIPR